VERADSFGSAPSSSSPPLFFMSSCQLGRAVLLGLLWVGSELRALWEVGGRGSSTWGEELELAAQSLERDIAVFSVQRLTSWLDCEIIHSFMHAFYFSRQPFI
jgi:hypothetical protein